MQLSVRVLLFIKRPETIGRKECPPLINRNGMSDNLKIRVVGGARVRETHSVVDPAYGTHRVPNTQEVWLALARESLFEIGRDAEVDLLLDHPDGVRNLPFVARGQQAHNVQHSAQRAGGVCSAAETKHVNVVARLKVSHQK